MPRNRRDDHNDDDSGEYDRPAKPRRRDDDDSGERDRPAKSRRRDDDESGEHEKPKKKGGLPGWALALIIVGAVLLVCGGIAGGIGYVLYNAAQGVANVASSIRAEASAREAKKMSREEFKAKVMGKTEAEVIALVGKPETTTQSGSYWWTYRGITVDPITGKTDGSITVTFENGKVVRVNY